MAKYVPGVCNIGPSEKKQRLQSGIFGAILALALTVFLFLTRMPAIFRLSVFIPAYIAAVGFLQYFLHFCVAFGIAGIYNVARSFGETDTVMQAEFRRQDRVKAYKIILLSAVLAAGVAVIAFLM
jgi:hypothetical protein